MKTFFRCLMLVLLLSSSCTGSKEEVDTFSSSRNLYVDFISSYTSGIVSNKARIKVKLAKKASEAKPAEKIGGELFRFEPVLKGTTYWEDNSTIVFEPDQMLADNGKYKVSFSWIRYSRCLKIKRSSALFSR